MEEKGDFMLDHDNQKAIIWARTPMEYAQVVSMLAPDIKAMGYDLVSYIQPDRPTDVNWEVWLG